MARYFTVPNKSASLRKAAMSHSAETSPIIRLNGRAVDIENFGPTARAQITEALTVTPPKKNVLTRSDLGFRGNVSRVAWELPSDLSETEWREAGAILGRVEHSVSWWLGDWWAFGENRYGDRKAIVEADDWEGPAYQTCRNAASIAGAFELSRRRDNLSFSHHAEVVRRPPKEADRLLDWAEETISETGKPQTIAALRAEVRASVRAEKKAAYFQRIEATKPKPLEGTYRVLYIDPPWKYHGLNQADEYGHAEAHYECLDDDQLIWFRPEQPKTEYHPEGKGRLIKDWADKDAVMFLWITAPISVSGRWVPILRAWGFEGKAEFIWNKDAHVMGFYNSVRHEHLLIATKGSCTPDLKKLYPSIQSFKRTEHSKKPLGFMDIIDKLYYGRKLEIFARSGRKRWDSTGDEFGASAGDLLEAAE
jgi:N6-adenosine-specific RNA methylase IME4